MKLRAMSATLSAALLLSSSFTFAAAPPDAAAARAMAAVRPEAIHADIAFLADDLLYGRFPGTPGYNVAAKFMASQFAAFGLQPAGDNGTFFQNVPLRASSVDAAKTTLTWTVAGGQQHSLTFAKDFIAQSDPLRADTQVQAPLVFVGFGITASELNFDSYKGIDAKGKIAVDVSGAPPQFESTMRAQYSSSAIKRENAAAHGAVGLIALDTPSYEHLYSFAHRVEGLGSPDMSWIDAHGNANDYFPEIKARALLNLDESRALIQAMGKSPDEIFAGQDSGKLISFETPVTLSLHIVTKSEDIQSPNVVAKLTGSDPALKNEYVVFTAHLDHLGVAEPVKGDSIYNGALDNASGSADLIEIARAMSQMNPRPRRSILFVSVTGEEEGLLGSDYFATNPTVPKSSIVADVNTDEDLMLWPLEDIVAYGSEHSTLAKVVDNAAAQLGLTVSPDPEPEQADFIRSDQYSFVKQGIPAIFVDAGVKSKDPKINPKKIRADWEDNIYHSPQDDMSQPFDLAAGVKFAQFNFLCGYLIAQAMARPAWNHGDFFGQHYANQR